MESVGWERYQSRAGHAGPWGLSDRFLYFMPSAVGNH